MSVQHEAEVMFRGSKRGLSFDYEGEGTCLCTRRCEWCQPLTATELAERKKLQDILATALAKDKIAEMRSTPTQEPTP